MSTALISIIALVAAIVFGIVRKVNAGIISVIFAFAVGQFLLKIKGADIYGKGFPTSIFFLMLALMFLFGIANINGTLPLFARKLTYLIRGNNKLLPFAFFLVTALLSGLGAGPGIAGLIFPIVMVIAAENGISVVLMAVMVMAGAMAGGLSPFAISGIVASTLAAKQGVHSYMPIYERFVITMVLEGIIAYLVFGGLKIKKADMSGQAPEKFNSVQIQTLIVIGLVIASVLFLKYDIGIAAFVGGAVLLALKVADPKEAVNAIAWDTLLLIAGVSIMVSVMTTAGGIKLLSDSLAKVMTTTTASSIMAIIAGLMAFVSSAVGVVMPTLIPTTGGIAMKMGGAVTTSTLIAGIVAGANSVIYSPLSTLGAMSFAVLPENEDKNKYFNKLIIVAFVSLLFVAVLGLLGLYRLTL